MNTLLANLQTIQSSHGKKNKLCYVQKGTAEWCRGLLSIGTEVLSNSEENSQEPLDFVCVSKNGWQSHIWSGLHGLQCMVQTCEVWEWVGRPGSETSPERNQAESFLNQTLAKKPWCFVSKLRLLMLTWRVVQISWIFWGFPGPGTIWNCLAAPQE